MTDISPLVRVALRYIGVAMVTRGFLSDEQMWIFSNPEIVGLVTLGVTEGWYFIARKFGWAT